MHIQFNVIKLLLLTIILATIRLTGIILIPWYIVFLPIALPFIAIICLFLFPFIFRSKK